MHGKDVRASGSAPGGPDLSAIADNHSNVSASLRMIRAVFFDAGDTLLRPRRPYGDLLTMVGQDLGIDLPSALQDGLARRIEERVTERTQRGQPFTFPAAASQMFWYETYYEYFLSHLPDDQATRLAQGMLGKLSAPSGYVLFEDTIDTLTELRRHGYHVGIISNWEAWLPVLLKASGVARYIDTTVISGICGIEKPDSRIFTLALEEAGLAPDEVVYVGDRPAHDVIPPQHIGIRPVLLDRDDRYPDHSESARINSLSEILTMLQSA
jgi:REG-2-like HAD superfamily hydrolase